MKAILILVLLRAALVHDNKVVWAGTRIVPMRRSGTVAGLVLLKDTEDRDGGLAEGTMFDSYYFALDERCKRRMSRLWGYVYVPTNPKDWTFDVDGDGSDEFLVAAQVNCGSNTHGRIGFHKIRWQLILLSAQGNDYPGMSICGVVDLQEDMSVFNVSVRKDKGALTILSWSPEKRNVIGAFRKDGKEWKYEAATSMPSN